MTSTSNANPSSENKSTENYYAEENATFGDRLAAAREALGLSQVELASRLGVKTKSILAWENDISEPRANRLSMLSGMLNVSIVWLLTGEGQGLSVYNEPLAENREMTRLLVELRAIRTEQMRLAEELKRFEKRLRQAVVPAETEE